MKRLIKKIESLLNIKLLPIAIFFLIVCIGGALENNDKQEPTTNNVEVKENSDDKTTNDVEVKEDSDDKTENSEDVKENTHNENTNNNFEKEYAKRAVVVALTNAKSPYVFDSDEHTSESTTLYDISKFKKYSDVEDDFLRVISDGSWEYIDDKWHVNDMKLVSFYDAYTTVSCDVSFDNEIYTISNVSGVTHNANHTVEDDLSSIERDPDHPYLTISKSLIEEDRKTSDIRKFDISVAQRAFENYGEALYPYGFKCHWFTDCRTKSYSNGCWYFEVGVTIENEYGNKRDAIATGTVNVIKQRIDDFIVE